ncbi:hypothetical protein [Acanthopleuribacter pedis]|uniref:Uncharacterized protein n=1 Tax=Acanthopleuribacter pedis TaxID=442870 RepID=A0A8J7QD08_9BACT|nr:hypothetical protein [Acanthopleuribacter pedis]MBO1321165.1 hypothetical protein [Acanthopleuribacter pedis]
MINLIFTALYEIVFSLNLSTWLHVLGLFVVICLMSSPGACATVVGVAAKMGIGAHALDKEREGA